jgi:hypothetical protein
MGCSRIPCVVSALLLGEKQRRGAAEVGDDMGAPVGDLYARRQ